MDYNTYLITLFKNYGLAAGLISCAIILSIGILKFFKAFDKIAKDNRKPIYVTLQFLFAFAYAAIYFAICKQPWIQYAQYAITVGSAVFVFYGIYENYGIRKLLQFVGTVIINNIAAEQLAKAKDTISKSDTSEGKAVEDTTQEEANVTPIATDTATTVETTEKSDVKSA